MNRRLLVFALSLLAAPGLASAQVALEHAGTLTGCGACSTDEIPTATNDAGELVIGVGYVSDNIGIDIDETGFGNQIQQLKGVGSNTAIVIESKVSGGSEPANLTFDWSTSETQAWGVSFTLSGVHADVYDQTEVGCGEDENSQTYPPSNCSITTQTDNAYVCSIVHIAGGAGDNTGVNPSGYDVFVDLDDAAYGAMYRLGMACEHKATAGVFTLSADEWDSGASASDWEGILIAFKADTGGGVYDTAPTVTSQTSTAYTVTGSLDAAGTVDGVACPKDQTAPTIGQVQAGDCTADVAAMATDTDSPVGGPFDFSLTLTLTNGFPIADLYVTDGTTLTTLADEALDVPAGENRCTLTSVDPTSPYDGVDVVAGDIVEIESLTTPDGYATFCEVDGTVGYVAGGDDSRQLIDSDVYDVSGEDIDEYLLVFNNKAPELVDDWPLASAVFEVNTDPAFDSEVYVTDAESDDMTWTIESGAVPTDWVLTAGTGVFSDGTPGACGNATFTLRATDEYSDFLDLVSDVAIGDAIPDVADVLEATAITTIEALCSLTTTSSDGCSATIVAGNVISTTPAIGTVVESDAEVTLTVSTGECPSGQGHKNLLRFPGIWR